MAQFVISILILLVNNPSSQLFKFTLNHQQFDAAFFANESYPHTPSNKSKAALQDPSNRFYRVTHDSQNVPSNVISYHLITFHNTSKIYIQFHRLTSGGSRNSIVKVNERKREKNITLISCVTTFSTLHTRCLSGESTRKNWQTPVWARAKICFIRLTRQADCSTFAH